jgi:KDO2-lipid IV(A) lauroyltransferase
MLYLLNFVEFIFAKPIAYLFKTFGNIRRKIADKNLEVCFPELSELERSKILNKHFHRLGASIFQGLKAWVLSKQIFKELLINLDEFDMDELRKSLQGNLILIPHTTDLEITGRVAAIMFDVNAMAKKQKGRLVNNFIFSSRDKYFKQTLLPNEVLKSMRLLQKGENLLYLPDQDYGYDHSIFVPYFNIPALTVKFPSIAKKRTGCKVYFLYLEDIKNRYKIILKEIDMSGENLYEDLALLNKEIETSIREQPERYLWIHRRFKHRPKDDLEIYDRSLVREKR